MRGLKGVTIQLCIKDEVGKDEFGRPIYKESWIDIDNVLIGEPSTDDITNTLTLDGKKVAYTLAIPKGDLHDWEDTKVIFFGETFKTIGKPIQGIEELIPLHWNKKVKVERYE